VTRHTSRRKARIDELADELAIGAAMRLRRNSDDIHDVVRAVVAYLIEEYPAQDLYVPSSVTYPVEELRADLAAGKSVRSICKRYRIDRRTLYRVVGGD
jgi:Mor family transcriptional regulator